jgi:hypothetical protein
MGKWRNFLRRRRMFRLASPLRVECTVIEISVTVNTSGSSGLPNKTDNRTLAIIGRILKLQLAPSTKIECLLSTIRFSTLKFQQVKIDPLQFRTFLGHKGLFIHMGQKVVFSFRILPIVRDLRRSQILLSHHDNRTKKSLSCCVIIVLLAACCTI